MMCQYFLYFIKVTLKIPQSSKKILQNKERWCSPVNPILDGLCKARNRAGGIFAPPLPRQISKTTKRCDKQQTAFDRSLKDVQPLYKNFFGQVNI